MAGGFGGSTSSTNQQQASESQGLPVNLQNPAYVGMAPGVAAGLASLYQISPSGFYLPGASATAGANPAAASVQPINYSLLGGTGAPNAAPGANPLASIFAGPSGGGATSAINNINPGAYQAYPTAFQPPGGAGGYFSPFLVNGAPASNPNVNPLVAPVTSQQWGTLGNIGSVTALPNLGNSGADVANALQAFTNPGFTAPTAGLVPQAASLYSQFMNPNFAASLATSPQTQAAIQSATDPIMQAFRTTTTPSLAASATQAGQRAGGAGQAGSSAFDQAFANAQGNLEAAIGQTAGGIANQAYQTGLGIMANAPGQAINAGGQVLQQALAAQQAPAQISAGQLNTLVNALQAEVLPQLTQQYGINQGLQLFNTQVQMLLQALGLGGQISQPAIAYNTQSSSEGTSTSKTETSPNIFGTLLGGLGAAGKFLTGLGGSGT